MREWKLINGVQPTLVWWSDVDCAVTLNTIVADQRSRLGKNSNIVTIGIEYEDTNFFVQVMRAADFEWIAEESQME